MKKRHYKVILNVEIARIRDNKAKFQGRAAANRHYCVKFRGIAQKLRHYRAEYKASDSEHCNSVIFGIQDKIKVIATCDFQKVSAEVGEAE